MHAHTNCKLVWQAPYQSLLGGVLVNVCIFHERAGYTLVSAFRLLKLILCAAKRTSVLQRKLWCIEAPAATEGSFYNRTVILCSLFHSTVSTVYSSTSVNIA